MPETKYPVELTAPDIEPYRAGNTGVEYVTTFAAAAPGPHVTVCGLTHGNEICGAVTLDKLFRAGIRPRQGKLTLAFNNVAAYREFAKQIGLTDITAIPLSALRGDNMLERSAYEEQANREVSA